MILLDTCYLIGFLTGKNELVGTIEKWLTGGEKLCTAAICWSEFLTGPVKDSQINAVFSLIEERVMPFGEKEAVRAAELYNATGRRRGTRIDSFIAAVAITNSLELATLNVSDFLPFESHGLSRVEE